MTANEKHLVYLYDTQKQQRVLQTKIAGSSHRLSALEEAGSQTPDRTSYRRLGLTGARWSNVTYRCVFAAARSAVRRQCLVQYMIALTGAVYPAVPITARAVPVTQKHMASSRLLTYPQCIA